MLAANPKASELKYEKMNATCGINRMMLALTNAFALPTPQRVAILTSERAKMGAKNQLNARAVKKTHAVR